jgi:putative peptidoglycan lipid II flippase
VPEPPPRPRRRLAFSAAIFAVGTALSRIAGLVRDIIAASYFGTTTAASAFTFAYQIPNLVAGLFAQAALSAAFIPVFTELLQQGRKREAFRLASSLFWIILIGLGAIIALMTAFAGAIMPLFTGSSFSAADNALTAGLAQVLFPVVLLLGLTGLFVGILQAFDEFTMPAMAPVAWNIVIIVLLVVLRPHFHSHLGIYAFAIAWLVATAVQFALVASALRRVDFRLQFTLDWRDPRVRQVFGLMLPVIVGLGIINLRQRHAPNHPVVDAVRHSADRAGHADHQAGLSAGNFHGALDAPRVDCPVLVRLQPPICRDQPAPVTVLLRRQKAVDSDAPGRDQHDR